MNWFLTGIVFFDKPRVLQIFSPVVKYPIMKKLKTHHIILLLILSASFFLLFYKLGDAGLWQDEAQTALVGKSVLETGLPHVKGDKNNFFQLKNAIFKENLLWRWHPWLQFYVSAASQKIFGKNTFGARALFVFFGFLCLPLIYLLAFEATGSRKTALLSVLFLAVSLTFIIMSRQSRYYSPLMFFFTSTLYGYLRILNRKQYGAFILAGSVFFLFHVIYAYIAPVAAAAAIHAFLFNRKILKKTILAFLIPAALNLPFLLWLYTLNYNPGAGFLQIIKASPERFEFYIKNIFIYMFGPVSCAGLAALAAARIRSGKKPEITHGLIPLLFLIFAAAGTAALLSFLMPLKFLRYLSPLLPVFAVINAAIAVLLYKLNKYAGVGFASLLIAFSGVHKHINEISTPYDGPLETVSLYLNSNADKNDIIYMGGYGDLPIKYYTNLRVIGGECRDSLDEINKAGWVIIRKNTNYRPDKESKKCALDNLDLSHYEKITLNAADTLFENRENPSLRHYGTPEEKEKVTLYKKPGR